MAEKVMVKIFLIMVTAVFVFLFYYCIRMTWENGPDLADEMVHLNRDSLVANVGWSAVALLVLFVVQKIAGKFPGKRYMAVLAGVVCLLAMLFSIYWVGASNTEPQADQKKLCDLASAFDIGDCSSLDKGEYAAKNAHQLGLVTIIRCLFRVFGDGNFRAFQYFTALLVPVIIFSGYRIIGKITREDRRAELYYLLFMILCVPLYGYVPFVYGEVCSTAFVMFSAWMLLECLERFSWIRALAVGGSMGVAVLMRRNTIIFFLAFLIVIIVKLIGRRCWQTAVIGISLALGVVAGQAAVNHIYAPLTPPDSKPTPSILYIVMGTNDEESGWHNRYHDIVYEECQYDPVPAAEQGWADLLAYWESCKANPRHAADFYFRKTNTQWNAPMYQCLAMNNKIRGGQSRLAENVYFGELRYKIQDFMNIYQILIYGGILFLLIANRKKWVQMETYILLVGIFGGFLFSLIWEAKTRYVFPYFVVMVPYAAIGISEIIGRVEGKLARKSGKSLGGM